MQQIRVPILHEDRFHDILEKVLQKMILPRMDGDLSFQVVRRYLFSSCGSWSKGSEVKCEEMFILPSEGGETRVKEE